MKIISRAEAKASGATRYFTNKPCKHGHIAERSTVNGTCLDCLYAVQSSEDYKKKRQAKGPGRPNTDARKIAISNGDLMYTDGRNCRKGHEGPRYTKTAICVQCSVEAGKSQRAKTYRRVNSGKATERASAWAKDNPEKYRANMMTARVRRRNRLKNGDSPRAIAAWIKSQDKVCFWCFSECSAMYHVDHVFAVSAGGKHVVENLAISCPKCNLTKNASDPVDFAISIGRHDLVGSLESLRSTLQF